MSNASCDHVTKSLLPQDHAPSTLEKILENTGLSQDSQCFIY